MLNTTRDVLRFVLSVESVVSVDMLCGWQDIKVVDSGFFLGGCVQGTCRVPHPKGVLSQTPLGWVESIEGGFQSLNPRSWRSSRRLRGCRERLLTQNALWGSGTARHLGPTPRGRLKFGCEHVCRTRTARNRRVKDARRSVTGPPSAASARSLRVAHFGARGRKPRFLNRKLVDVPFSGHICYIPRLKLIIVEARRARKTN